MAKIGTTDNGRPRSSNIEFLRIVSMMMVVVVHLDGGCLGIPNLDGDWSRMDGRILWRMGVESLAFIGVNCFTLISGYFGIRLRLKSVVYYLFECLFYAVGIYLIACTMTPGGFTWRGLGDSCLVLTHTDLWYVPAYFILMLLSPLLNAGFENMSRRKGFYLTLAFVVFNLWAGWWWGGKFNAAGYTAWQLVMMYCIGRVISAYKKELTDIRRVLFFRTFNIATDRKSGYGGSEKLSMSRNWLGIYVICSIATVIIGVYDFRRAYSYNQPFVVLASVAFFLFFTSLRFHSRIVNYAAKSAFAAYLLHKSPLIWSRYLRPAAKDFWTHSTLGEYSLWVIGVTIAIYLAAMSIDLLRRFLSDTLWKPLNRLLIKSDSNN